MKTQLIFLLLLFYLYAECQSGPVTPNLPSIVNSVTIDPNPANDKLIEVYSNIKSLLTPRLTSTQRSAITSPPAGLIVYDTSTNSHWYFNGSSWGEMNIFAVYRYWNINGANQESEGSSSVGINIFAAKAKFQVAAKYRPQAIFGTNYSGISFAANPPVIGFNIYNDSTTNRHLTTGYGFLQEFSPTTGQYSLKPLSYRVKDSSTVQNSASYFLTNSGQFGSKFAIDISEQTRFFNNDFSKFGENAPEIKCKVFTGTTLGELSPGPMHWEYTRYTNIALGIASAKILKISIIIECGGSRPFVPPNQCGDSFYGSHCYRYYLGTSGFLTIVHEGEASLDTYSKPYKIFVIYTD